MYWRTTVRRDQVQVGSRGTRIAIGAARKSDPFSVRRPARVVSSARLAGDSFLLAARNCNHPNITQCAVIGARSRACGVRYSRSIGRPLRIANGEFTLRQTLFFFLVDVEDPEMRHLDVMIDDHRVVFDFLAILFIFVWLIR